MVFGLISTLIGTASVLVGKWEVVCPHCEHAQMVYDHTKRHTCEQCRRECAINGKDGWFTVRGECGHTDRVEGVTKQHGCSHQACGRQMRRD